MSDVVSLNATWAGQEPPKQTESTNTDLFDSHIAQCKADIAESLRESIIELIAFSKVLGVEQIDDPKVNQAIANGHCSFPFISAQYFGVKVTSTNGLDERPTLRDFVGETPTLESILDMDSDAAQTFLDARKSRVEEYRKAFQDLTSASDLGLLDVREIAVNDTSHMIHKLQETLRSKDSKTGLFRIVEATREFMGRQDADLDEVCRDSAETFVSHYTDLDADKDMEAYTFGRFLQKLTAKMNEFQTKGRTAFSSSGQSDPDGDMPVLSS